MPKYIITNGIQYAGIRKSNVVAVNEREKAHLFKDETKCKNVIAYKSFCNSDWYYIPVKVKSDDIVHKKRYVLTNGE